jgi:hypothetical protein
MMDAADFSETSCMFARLHGVESQKTVIFKTLSQFSNLLTIIYHEPLQTKSNSTSVPKITTLTATTEHHTAVCLCKSYFPVMRPWEKSEGWKGWQSSRLPTFCLLLHSSPAQSVC